MEFIPITLYSNDEYTLPKVATIAKEEHKVLIKRKNGIRRLRSLLIITANYKLLFAC